MSTLFEDAIAEAKQLRELAEQNAKNAIVEAVTPRIREFIEEQLLSEEENSYSEGSNLSEEKVDDDILDDVVNEIMSEMEEGEKDSEEELLLDDDEASADHKEESYDLDEDAMNLLSKMLNERDDLSPEEQKLKSIVLSMHTLKTKMSSMNESQREEVTKIISKVKSHLLTNEGKMLENDMINVDLNEEKAETEVDELQMEEIASDEDDTVDEALNELRLLLDLGEPDEDGDFDMDAVVVADADLEEEAPEEAPEEEAAEPPADEEPVDDEFVDDIELEDEKESSDEELQMEASEQLEEELEIDEAALVAALREMKEARTEPINSNDTTNESAQIATLRGQVAEYAKAVNSLREQLTEMNLFNAKLLYVNKLVQDKNVTSEQRRGIVESLDGAKTLREVKLLYKGLTKSLKTANTSTKKGQISESAARRSIGSSSRPVGTQSTQKSHSESADPTSNRWATLAGLK
jgi:hypothetical protein